MAEIAYCYARVSTQMQVEEGVSLDAQERQLRYAAELAGYEVIMLREEGRSGKNIRNRPILRKALQDLAEGNAVALYVTRLDRLARSTQDFLSIIDMSQKQGWRLALLDIGLDTATPQGRFVVTIMAAMAEMERGMISERAKDIHKDRREQPNKRWGIDLGPKPLIEEDIRLKIKHLRDKGMSYHAIAKHLNYLEIETSNGGKEWYASTVRHAYISFMKSVEE
jgi:DNA invertase Pin-like site-specific DNA recombinase